MRQISRSPMSRSPCLITLQRIKAKKSLRPKPLSHYLTKIARLGGYLARANDSPPGNTVMWRGLSRLTDIGRDRGGRNCG
jgi:hypothetical protein